jgi:hypothetical protein
VFKKLRERIRGKSGDPAPSDHSASDERKRRSSFISGRSQDEKSVKQQRDLRIGVDFGTSRSKLVIKDYSVTEGDRLIVVRPDAVASDGGYLIPSTVALEGGRLLFGYEAEALAEGSARARSRTKVYRSLKMLAAFPDAFYGDPTPLPEELTATDLATLYVLHLLQLGEDAAAKYSSDLGSAFRLSMTMGAPMDQLDDPGLRAKFVEMARAAYFVRREQRIVEGVSISDAKAIVTRAREMARQSPVTEVRDWVRSEAESALLWAHRSPKITSGRYSCVDVGAGTTSATWFHINASRHADVLTKDRLSFYGAACSPPGADAIADLIFKSGAVKDRASARGHENEWLARKNGVNRSELNAILDQITDVYGEASERSYAKEQSRKAWSQVGNVFLLGGGSKIEAVSQSLINRKADWLRADAVVDPGVPPGLVELDGATFGEDPSFILVAYGLAHRLGDTPDVSAPSDINDLRPPRNVVERPRHDQIYSD